MEPRTGGSSVGSADGPRSHDSTWIPVIAATPATIAAVAAADDGSASVAKKPITAKMAKPPAPTVNERRATSPSAAPTRIETPTMKSSSASLSF